MERLVYFAIAAVIAVLVGGWRYTATQDPLYIALGIVAALVIFTLAVWERRG